MSKASPFPTYLLRVFLLLPLTLFACGGSDAVSKCNALVDRICDRAVDCVAGYARTRCVTEVSTAINCAISKSISTGYNTCMSTLQSTSCATLFPGGVLDLPVNCNGVIQQ